MYINKPSVTKIEAADRVNLLHRTIYSVQALKWQRPLVDKATAVAI